MVKNEGFGIVMLLIAVAILVFLAAGSFYFYFGRSIETVTGVPPEGDTTGDTENQKSAIEQARDIKDMMEARDRAMLEE